jgi:hypothetical protein
MSPVPAPAPAVKPDRPANPAPHVEDDRPFTRPVQTAERVTMQLGPMAGGFLLLIGAGPRTKSYAVTPAVADFGSAYRVESRVEGNAYDVLLDGHASNCSCPGFSYTGGCKHLSALLSLQAEGRLS